VLQITFENAHADNILGPFRAIEESTLSHLTNPKTRSDVLAWYITTASLGASLGTEISGRLVDLLATRFTITQAYHAMFWIYTGMGLVGIVLTLMLSSKCEIEKLPQGTEESEILLDDRQPKTLDDDEDRDQSSTKQPATPEKKKGFRDLFTEISPETRSIMYKLWFLLIIDSLADGMVPYSLTNYYLDQKFHLAKSTLGDITSISYLLASCSTVFAGPLARRLGLIPTMVFTHIRKWSKLQIMINSDASSVECSRTVLPLAERDFHDCRAIFHSHRSQQHGSSTKKVITTLIDLN
jgi:hypothetical protein